MLRTFEQVINSMSDVEFNALLDSVKHLRDVSIPVDEYFNQIEHTEEFIGQREAAYKYILKVSLEDVSNIESVLAA